MILRSPKKLRTLLDDYKDGIAIIRWMYGINKYRMVGMMIRASNDNRRRADRIKGRRRWHDPIPLR